MEATRRRTMVASFALLAALPLLAARRAPATPIGSSWFYSGPHADEVQYLLARAEGWQLPSCATCADLKAPDIPLNPNSVRDTYVGAAMTWAFGAEAYAKVGNAEKAEEAANSMHESLKQANDLCGGSGVTVDARGSTPATLRIWPCPPPTQD